MKRLCIVTMALTMILAVAATAFAVAPPAPENAVEMKFPGEKTRYAPVMFEHHDRHLAVEGSCNTCHHKWDGTSEITGCRVNGCHADTSKAGKKEPTSYDSAFHDRKAGNSCTGCHTVVVKADAASKAPKSCNTCHTPK